MTTMRKPFTGRHFALIMVAFFGVVITVNLVMARYASATFGGVVVENSYVASQRFNTWLGKARTQAALGWDATAFRERDGRVRLSFRGVPDGLTVTAIAHHPLGRRPDTSLAFVRATDGQFRSVEPLAGERWLVRVTAAAGAATWRKELEVR